MGTNAVGWSYSSHEYADTERWMGLFHEVAPAAEALDCSACHGGGRMDFDALGYTPRETGDGGEPLCESCHGPKTGDFSKIHRKHVDDLGYDCSSCHTFSAVD